MAITDLGLVNDNSGYRTHVTCDAPDCAAQFDITTDRYHADEAPDGADVRIAQLLAGVIAAGGTLTQADGEELRYLCAEHAPAQPAAPADAVEEVADAGAVE